MKRRAVFGTLLVAFLLGLSASGQTPASPQNQASSERIQKILGFDLSKTTMHFWLLKSGGAIEIVAKDANDPTTVNAIRKYLEREAKEWGKGNFDTVYALHGKDIDGVAGMKKYRDDITFDPKSIDGGGALRLFTFNDTARQAIQAYIRSEINEYHTGDPTQVTD